MKEIVRQNFDVIAQKLGLQPKRFPTKEEALNACIGEFLNADNFSGGILELPQKEEKGQEPVEK